ncbi:hypothetical protein OG2516_15384 [Oceanicola granulosus HTCC2516]|uniref:DnaJ homologue subfamily C member 28 conserved domain-containing protein n=1 Tax=Oceanicola granulosus (strain ATCC BAA-861 / DSM 15982 / KCTC 12143 / HTCC2516) TaxID=314256 RepID=Q2CFD6_OCEGH|nr:DnaJ family domain-containing protein [Oceanicola granulosus]EAR51359.1 hypothetical protein OG2516_15384 [Oceanicola granulosus HTCC2516]
MSGFLRRIFERHVERAEAEGKLSGLAGEGKPLEIEQGGDVTTEIGHKVMAEAGVVPLEVTLVRQLAEARAAYGRAEGADEKKAAMARIADLEMKKNLAFERLRRHR